MTKKNSKTTAKNTGGRCDKRSTKTLFVFFSLILSLSLLTNACRSKSGGDGDPPDGGNGQPPPTMLTPKQVVIDGMTINEGLDSISFGWSLDTNSTGEDIVGVVAVLSTGNLGMTDACQAVPEGILTHARDGSGSGSETSGNPRYMAANDNDGSTITFGGLTANTTYSLALCSVSADKIRGDGTGGAANQAVVRSVMTSEPPPELPPRQVTIGSIVSGSNSIRFVWALDAMNTTGETVVGVVAVLAVLREATDPLPVDSVCQNVPEAILTYARTGSGTSTQDSGGNIYMADNNSEGSTLTFSALTPGTDYSLAVCSVSAMKIRGDGENGNAVVQNVMTDFLPPQQVTIGGIDVGLDSLGFTWALDGTLDMTQNAPVVGVVAVLSTGTLTANSACAGVPAGDPNDTSVPDVIGFARGVSTGSESATVGGVRYIAVNDGDGSDLTFEDLTANTTYSLAVCSVSDNKIRGTAGGGDAAIASEGPMTEMPPQQVEFVDGMTTVTSDSITFDWQTPAGTGQPVLGVVAVLREGESALNAVDACASVPSPILAHARNLDTTIMNPLSDTATVGSVTFTYIADNRNGFDTGTMMPVSHTVTFSGLMPDTEYTIALCSVSAEEIRGDGGQGGNAVVQSQRTDTLPPKQVAAEVTSGTTSIDVTWSVALDSMDSSPVAGAAIQGVVALLRDSTATPALTATNSCQTFPDMDSDGMAIDISGHARGSSGTNPRTFTTVDSGTTTTYIADNGDTSGTLSFTGLTAGTEYSLVLCSVSGDKIRGDGTTTTTGDGTTLNNEPLVESVTTVPVPKQVEGTATTGLDSISFAWSVDDDAPAADLAVAGVVAVLGQGTSSVAAGNACAMGTLPTGSGMNVLEHASGSETEPTLTVTTGASPNTITYVADNRNAGGTITFSGLPISTTYSLVVCSVAVDGTTTYIRGDGTGGATNQALLVGDVTTLTPAKQITVTLTNIGLTTLSLTWSAPAATSSASDVVGVVAVLKELDPDSPAPLVAGDACEPLVSDAENLPMNTNVNRLGLVLAKARSGDGTTDNRSSEGRTTRYIASTTPGDPPSGSASFTGLTEGTPYSLAVCAVSATSLRGDGSNAMMADGTAVDNNAVVQSITPMQPFPKQASILMPMGMQILSGSPSITVTWSVDTASAGRDVIGVVGVLRPPAGSVNANNICSSGRLPSTGFDFLNHFRTNTVSNLETSTGSVTLIAQSNLDGDDTDMDPDNSGSITFSSGLTEGSTYSIAICSVAYEALTNRTYIRGDDVPIDREGNMQSLGTPGSTRYPAALVSGVMFTAQSPVKQITATAVAPMLDGGTPDDTSDDTPDRTKIKVMDINWYVSGTESDREDVVGIVAVLQEQDPAPSNPITVGSGCMLPSGTSMTVLAHARGDSTTHPTNPLVMNAGGGITYVADHRVSSDMSTPTTTTVTGLEPAVAHSIVMCAVSMNNLRGDGNTLLVDSMDNNIDLAVLLSATTNTPVSPKQVKFTMVESVMTPSIKTSTQVTVGWAEDDDALDDDQAIVGVVGAAYLSTNTAVSAVNVCENVPEDTGDTSIPDLLSFARGSTTATADASGTAGGVSYMASNSDSGNLTFTGLTPGSMYNIAVCSVSADNIRGDDQGRIDQAAEGSITTPGVVVIYKSESVLVSTNDHALSGGLFTAYTGFTSQGTGICAIKRDMGSGNQADGAWGLPEDLDGSGFSNHTFYGSTAATRSGTEGPFSALSDRLGVVDAEKQEVWVYYVPKTSTGSRQTGSRLIQPSELVTLAQLIALDSDGDYTNQAQVERVFALLQNGDSDTNMGSPASQTDNFEYWSFTGRDGGIAMRSAAGGVVQADCAADGSTPGTSTSDRGAFGRHDNGDGDSYIGGTASDGRQTNCTAADKTVLCIARQDSGF